MIVAIDTALPLKTISSEDAIPATKHLAQTTLTRWIVLQLLLNGHLETCAGWLLSIHQPFSGQKTH